MATTSRRSSKTRPTAGRSTRQGSARTSSPVLQWIRTLLSRSSRIDRSPPSGQIASASGSPPGSALRRELWGIAMLLFALFLAGALAAQGMAMLRAQGTEDVRSSFGWIGSLLASPMAEFLGWPAAALIPVALAAHALRLFGRLDQDLDRSWMVFLLGLVALLPVALGLGEGGLREQTALSGLWGSFSAFYLLQFAGRAGAWIIVLLSLSALMAATLSWNPIRAIVGRRPEPAVADDDGGAEEPAPVEKVSRRKPTILPPEPTPEEMPALDVALMNGSELTEEQTAQRGKKREKKSRADLATAHDERIAAAIDSTALVGAADEDLPSRSEEHTSE